MTVTIILEIKAKAGTSSKILDMFEEIYLIL